MKTNIYIIFLVAMTLFLAGCATEPSRLEMDHGTSYKLAIHNQIANPDAEKNLEQVNGLDGKVAETNVAKYRKSFERPLPTTNTYILSVPGASQ